MKNPTNNSEFMDDINADDLFIEADMRDDCPEFQSMDAFAPGVIDNWDDVDPVAEGFHPGHE